MPTKNATRCERVEQVAIIDKLLRYPRGATLAELAKASDASQKTARRIVAFVEDRFGAKVHRLADGQGALWRYENGQPRIFTTEATRRL